MPIRRKKLLKGTTGSRNHTVCDFQVRFGSVLFWEAENFFGSVRFWEVENFLVRFIFAEKPSGSVSVRFGSFRFGLDNRMFPSWISTQKSESDVTNDCGVFLRKVIEMVPSIPYQVCLILPQFYLNSQISYIVF